MPVLKKWRIFEREDFTGEGAKLRDELALVIKDLELACDKFEVSSNANSTGKPVRARRSAHTSCIKPLANWR